MYDKVKFKLYIFHLAFQQSPWLNNVIFFIIFAIFTILEAKKKTELINIYKYANDATCLFGYRIKG